MSGIGLGPPRPGSTDTSDKVAKAGDTMTGPLVLPGDPTQALQAAPRQYVLAQIALAVNGLVNGAEGALDTLGELAAQMRTDEGALVTSLAAKATATSWTGVKTADYSAAANESVPFNIASSRTLTLPTAPADKTRVAAKIVAGGSGTAGINANTLTIARGGSSDVINVSGGSTSFTMFIQNQAVGLEYSATAGIWYVVAGDLPYAQLVAVLDARYAAAARVDALESGSARRRLSAPFLRGQLATLLNAAPVTSYSGTYDRTFRQRATNGPVAQAGLRLYFGWWKATTTGDALLGGGGTLKVAVEYNGVLYPVYFGAQRTVTVDDGATVDGVCAAELPAGANFYVRTRVVTSATAFPGSGINAVSANGDSYVDGDSVDATGALANASNGAGLMFPIAITGFPEPGTSARQVVIVGDSIAYGTGDPNAGFIRRGLGSGFPNIDLGLYGDKASNFLANHQRRGLLLGGSDYAIEENAWNDTFGGGVTLAVIQASRLGIWTLLAQRGAKVFATTCTPYTTSTDSWATTANQTIPNAAKEAVRTGLNDWLRAGAPIDPGTKAAVTVGTAGALVAGVAGHPLTGVFDAADLAETARNSGIWKAGYVGDGIHPNATGAAAIAPCIDTSKLT